MPHPCFPATVWAPVLPRLPLEPAAQLRVGGGDFTLSYWVGERVLARRVLDLWIAGTDRSVIEAQVAAALPGVRL